MELKNEPHIFKGLQRDMSISKYDPSFLYDAHNIRLTSREDDTMLSITNEKGTKDTHISVIGSYLGHCIIDKSLVVFTTGDKDYIFNISLDKPYNIKCLFSGDLNFNIDNKITTLASYENNRIQKVYWIDGRNQPRVINIKSSIYDSDTPNNDGSIYNFVSELSLKESIDITKTYDSSGLFAPGVIQYAFTYYNKYGQESNIFHTTPLQYVSYKDRGGSPEDKIGCAFVITVNNIDTKFDYLRIYSIFRSSINATPVVKRVSDISIKNLTATTELKSKAVEISKTIDLNFTADNKGFWSIDSEKTIEFNDYADPLYLTSDIQEYNGYSVTNANHDIITSSLERRLVVREGKTLINESDCPYILEAYGLNNIPDGEYRIVSYKEDCLKQGEFSVGYSIFRTGNSHYIHYTWNIIDNSIVTWQVGSGPDITTPVFTKLPTEESDTDFYLIMSTTPINGRHYVRGIYYDSKNCYIADIKESEYQYSYDANSVSTYASSPSFMTSKTTSITYIDYNTSGDDVDPTQLLYIGGEEIIAGAMTQKDGTLFFGNYSTKRKQPVLSSIKSGFSPRLIPVEGKSIFGTNNYSMTSFENSSSAGFKYGDYYRLGIQFQHKTGKWSDPIYVDDYKVEGYRPALESLTLKKLIIAGTIQFSEDDIENIKLEGYIKLRPVVVYPSLQDRTVICQAVACPTVYTQSNRDNKSVYAQSSWFFRPYTKKAIKEGIANSPFSEHNKYLPYYGNVNLDLSSIYTDGYIDWLDSKYKYGKTAIESDFYYVSRHTEIVSITDTDSYETTVYEEQNDWTIRLGEQNLIKKYEAESNRKANQESVLSPVSLRSVEIQGNFSNDKKFKVDWGTCTFHSPEIDSDDSLFSYPLDDIKVRIVGYAEMSGTSSKIAINTKTPTIGSSSTGGIDSTSKTSDSSGIIAGLFYDDYMVSYEGSDLTSFSKQKNSYKWAIYPWQMSGALNNDFLRPSNKGTMSAELKTKKLSNIRYSNTIFDFSENKTYYNDILYNSSVNVPQLFSSDQVAIVKLGDDIYEGNIDTGIMPNNSSVFFAKDGEYNDSDDTTIFSNSWYGSKVTDDNEASTNTIKFYKWDGYKRWSEVSALRQSKYPSLGIKKAIVRMKYKSTPHIVAKIKETTNGSNILFDYVKSVVGNTDKSVLPIVEFYKDVNPDTIFGGKEQDALQANLWFPAGESYNVSDIKNNSITLQYIYGDTWYGNYDILKTYAFTPEDENQIVEIGSFQLESHVNPVCRYDRNRGLTDNTNINNTNFNLQNKVYNQQDNFFSYRTLDSDYYKIDDYPNQITWTKEKTSASQVDAWTNVTLANTHDLDGNKGEIVALNSFNGNIYCFQTKGISNILFNSRAQIPTSDGVPIEITNNYRLEGSRYLSDGIGCSNKLSIEETPTGIYFIDTFSNNLYHIGDGVSDVSTAHNMTSWFKHNNINKVLHDRLNHDVYVITDSEALCYSEVLGQFTSFMSYSGIDFIEVSDNSVFTMKESDLYEMFTGGYNMFFGQYKPWDITIISNGRDQSLSGTDKTFSTIEYRMDLQTSDYLHKESFDYIQITNEYQDTGIVALTSKNLKKKFRIWHIDIPRNIKLDDWGRGARDRIRNTWCKIKLGMWSNANPNYKESKRTAKAELHDIITQYLV